MFNWRVYDVKPRDVIPHFNCVAVREFPQLLCWRWVDYNQTILSLNIRIPSIIWIFWRLVNYCWWTKSCTTKDDDYPIIYRVLTIPGGARFRPSTVSSNFLAWICLHGLGLVFKSPQIGNFTMKKRFLKAFFFSQDVKVLMNVKSVKYEKFCLHNFWCLGKTHPLEFGSLGSQKSSKSTFFFF